MMRREPEPGGGSAFLGAAAASLATGPTLVVIGSIHELVTDQSTPSFLEFVAALGSLFVYSAVICLIGSVPAATLNAIALGQLARRERDAVWWAMASGGGIGLLVAMVISELTDSTLYPILASWFSATGALMGWLHWLIAIRPRRRWRLWLQRDQEAIRAME